MVFKIHDQSNEECLNRESPISMIETQYGHIRADFEKKTLKDVCVAKNGVQTGPFGSQLHKKDYVNEGTPIITVEHLGDNRIIDVDTPFVSDEDKERLNKYVLMAGDIVFSRVGSVDRRAIVREKEDGWLFSGRCLRVRVNNNIVDPHFLSYFFGTELFKEHIRRIAVGATMPSINTKILSEIEIYYPSLIEQKAIAQILSTLDEKIETNNRINQVLEEVAQSLFKRWFVDFEFPNEDGEPYKSTSGEMVESELGLIPKGWSVSCISEIAINIKDSIHPTNANSELVYVGLEHIPRKKMMIDSWDTEYDLGSNKYLFKRLDILFGKLRPYFHKVSISTNDGICSTDILVIRAKESLYHSFLFNMLFTDDFVKYANAVSTGTRMPRTNYKSMGDYKIVIAPKEIHIRFSKIIDGMNQLMMENTTASKKLASLRDTLLPKLMSGEMSVLCK